MVLQGDVATERLERGSFGWPREDRLETILLELFLTRKLASHLEDGSVAGSQSSADSRDEEENTTGGKGTGRLPSEEEGRGTGGSEEEVSWGSVGSYCNWLADS